MEKAKIRIEKRGTEKCGYIFLAFLIIPFCFEELVTIADSEDRMEVRLSPWRRRFELEVERKYAT